MKLTRSNDEIFIIKFVCNEKSASSLWKCMANITVTCRTSGPSEKFPIQEISAAKSLNYLDNRIKIKFDTEAWPKFAEAQQLHLVAKIHLSRVSGVRKRKIIDYSLEQPLIFNGILSIEGQKVHINKQLLAMHSKYFENLFFGNFAENQLEIVELPDVKHSEFCEFLDIIHPTQTEIEKSTVESLLKMADRFQTEAVAARCEKFLMSSKEVPMVKKLILAQQYRLGELMVRIFSENCVFRLKFAPSDPNQFLFSRTNVSNRFTASKTCSRSSLLDSTTI